MTLFRSRIGHVRSARLALGVAYIHFVNLAVLRIRTANSHYPELRSILVELSEQPSDRMVVGSHHQKSAMCRHEAAIRFDFAVNRKYFRRSFKVGKDGIVRDRGCGLLVAQKIQASLYLRGLAAIQFEEGQSGVRDQRQAGLEGIETGDGWRLPNFSTYIRRNGRVIEWRMDRRKRNNVEQF